MAKALVCSRCNAPLPSQMEGAVTCAFCGAVNEVRGRRVAGGAPSQGSPTLVLGIGLGILVLGIAGGLATFTLQREVVQGEFALGPAPQLPELPEPTPPSPPSLPPAPVLEPWGELLAVEMSERGDVLALLGDVLVQVDTETFTARWSTTLSSDWRFAGNYRVIVPRGEHVAVIADKRAAFFEAATGAKVNDFKYRRGGILQRTCAAGANQVLVDVLGSDLQRFDASTGLLVSNGPSCTLRDKMGCPSTQRCGWDRFEDASYDCRYAVRAGKAIFRDCTTNDGQENRMLVRAGNAGWASPSFVRPDRYFGVVSDTLIIAGSTGVLALDAETGEERWRRRQSVSTAIVAEGATLYLGDGQTLVAVDARSGDELKRLPLRTVAVAAD